MAERITRLSHDLDAEVNRQTAMFDRGLAAEEVLAKYRAARRGLLRPPEPPLQHPPVGFFTKYADSSELTEEGVRTTLFRLAQYFGWTEILRA